MKGILCAGTVAWIACAAMAWEVKDLNGAPGLYRDGAPVAPLFFWQWELQEPDVREMSRQGFDLFAMFGSFPHYKHPYWRADGSFNTAYYDAQFDAALRWNPSAQLLPRLFVTAPDWWSELNTNEQFVAEVPTGQKVSWEHLPRESFASVKAREEVGPYYRRLVRHLIDKYGRNLLGVHVTNGPWGEDFSWEPTSSRSSVRRRATSRSRCAARSCSISAESTGMTCRACAPPSRIPRPRSRT